jgi:hypothetical protein
MKEYLFYQWIEDSGSLMFVCLLNNDQEAINKLLEFPEGRYEITLNEEVNTSVSYTKIVYSQT